MMAPLNNTTKSADTFNTDTNGIPFAGKKGVIVYPNELLRAYSRLPEGAVIGLPIGDLIPHTKRDASAFIRTIQAINGRRMKKKKACVVANISPNTGQREVVKASISFKKKRNNVEQLSKHLDAYRRQNKLLEAIFTASSDGLWIADDKGVIVAWNPAAEKNTGIKAEEVVGRAFTELDHLVVIKDNFQYISEAAETKRRVITFNVYPRSKRLVLGNATPVLDEDENVTWIVGNENDLSELKALNEELENALAVSQKAKEELTGLNLAELRDQEIVVKSKAMQQVLQVAVKLTNVDASHIMITGESGTGKGLLAKFIHKKSVRSAQPFIQINCAAVPENLLEAELFGYEKGAFTGASDKGKAGLIELAQNGTLFLDEIGDMPMRLQAKLLKYLDDHEVMRLGSVKARKIDCAIVSATNQDPEALVEEKRFRQDLFFRLNHFPIHIPPLRERAEDILELVHFFIRKYNKQYKRQKRVTAQGIETMQSYAFPGNVRELRSLCKQAVLMSDEILLDRCFAKNLQKMCTPAGMAATNKAVRINSVAASIRDGNDPVMGLADGLAKILIHHPPGGSASSAFRPEGTHPLLQQVIRKAIDMGRGVYTEICRELSASPASGLPQQSPIPAAAETLTEEEKALNLKEALGAYEREIFLKARRHCRTIRELAAHLQISPATALRKLKKHELSLIV